LAALREQLQAGLANRYRLERELGRGGMATVFLAQDLRHDRPVALKVLHPELAATLGSERFQREIRLAARLQHPHILTVLDSGEASGHLWFTMPFVEGESLRDRLSREKQLPVEDAVRIVREAALALEYAHQHGVVHRDIKPENILLTSDGSTLVADFGIARAIRGEGEQLTETGMAVGTPAYMSPEQASGERDLDARSDVYALGSVLYEMLAGGPPFSGATAQAVIAQTLTASPQPLVLHRPGVNPALDRVVQQALAKAPADRFGSMAELARALPRGTGTVAAATAPTRGLKLLARRPLIAALAIGFLLGLGVLFAWRRSHTGAASAGPTRLAVLPFENLGDTADAYFADGVSDAVRGKLMALTGLTVIARGSSEQYRHSTKSPQEIGRELGVDYLLTGTVRWAKGKEANRVQVSPELIRVSDAAGKWQQPFDAALTDVFQVQADIAGQVAEALNLALGSPVRAELAKPLTENTAAYDAYLKGEAATQGLGRGDTPSLQGGIGYYERAVALDSTFVEAWTQLARTRALLYYNGTPTSGLAEATRQSAERARALGPGRPESYLALGDYYSLVLGENSQGLSAYEAGLRAVPGSAELLTGAALSEQSLGRWEAALTHLQRAQSVDPRSILTARRLAVTLLWLRRYSDALTVIDRSLALGPNNLELLEAKTMVSLGQGDLSGARSVVRATQGVVEPTTLAAYFGTYWDLFWVLDDAQQQLLLRLSPSAFDGDRGTWGLVLAQTWYLRGETARARAYAVSARAAFEEQLRGTPENTGRQVALGLALAYMGRKYEAIRAGELATALVPLSKDAYGGPYTQHQLARIYILTGEPEQALDQLEPLLKIPYYLSPGWLKIDPNFDPLRNNPRFQKLVAGS